MKDTSFTNIFSLAVALALLASGCVSHTGGRLSPSTQAGLDSDATVALGNLYTQNEAARVLGGRARAILIFPNILKGGFMVGGQVGNGVLRQDSRTTGYYNIMAGSYGFQAGLQRFGYIMFLMNDAAINHLNATGGLEVGVGPSVVVFDQGMARSITTATLHEDIYAFIFNQSGLMAGAGLQGSKITRVSR